MIVKQYIKDFEKHKFGMFVHFGLYSALGKGEWSHHLTDISAEDYERLAEVFSPDADWAEKLVDTARAAGCRYITITTRHHDGFSLYNTLGLNDYDAPHMLGGRDLIREFVDACNEGGIVPFFYHTLLDWREASYNENFSEYLKYLRRSVEILCTEYGKIGGLWFDGMWNKWEEDWEEDALYSLIRAHQPEAMIINNTGLSRRGELGHIELDSVTFERGNPSPINFEGAPKYLASEMCQVFGDHWGYAELDYNYKSMADIITDYCTCRRFKSNFLMNVGPMANGKLRPLDDAMLRTLGQWVSRFSEAFDDTVPCGIEVSKEKDFILKSEKTGAYYLFCHGLSMGGDSNVATCEEKEQRFTERFELDGKISSVNWLADGAPVSFEQDGRKTKINLGPQPYGQSVVVRIAKILTE